MSATTSDRQTIKVNQPAGPDGFTAEEITLPPQEMWAQLAEPAETERGMSQATVDTINAEMGVSASIPGLEFDLPSAVHVPLKRGFWLDSVRHESISVSPLTMRDYAQICQELVTAGRTISVFDFAKPMTGFDPAVLQVLDARDGVKVREAMASFLPGASES